MGVGGLVVSTRRSCKNISFSLTILHGVWCHTNTMCPDCTLYISVVLVSVNSHFTCCEKLCKCKSFTPSHELSSLKVKGFDHIIKSVLLG